MGSVAAQGNQQAKRSAVPFRRGYLPTLDGWRAIAILIVLLDHSPTGGQGHLSTYRFHYLGNFGVQIFFALSGLLITSRLLDEEEVTGALHLRGFYIRRVTRIQPAALVYLATVTVLMLVHRLPEAWEFLLASVFMFRNFVNVHDMPHGWPTVHFWSLSVEEHFYLLLPGFLVLVKRRRGAILLGAAVLDTAWYLYNLACRHWVPGAFYFRTDMCVHTLILAASLAVFLRTPKLKRGFTRWVRWWWVVPVTVLAMRPASPASRFLFLVPCALVLSTLLHPHSVPGRMLESAPMRFVGRISYSLYLWQQLFFSGFFAPTLHPFGRLQHLWFLWPAAITMALISYYLIEKPFIKVGHRLAAPATPGRPV